MKVCVVGGAGFIGSNFINYMINKYRDIQIVCIDFLTYAGNLENLELVRENTNFKFYRGNILDERFLHKVFSKEEFNIVVNFAAESHVDRSIKEGKIFLETNIIGTKNIMDMCIKYGVERFHQVSTDEVYGDMDIFENKSFVEEDSLKPSSTYSVSKASADMLAMSYFRTFNLPVTISRSSNNYGPYQYPEKLIPVTIMKAIKNEKIPVYGTGENVRDWIHVYDHVIAIDKIINSGKNGEIYNICSKNEMRNIDLVKKLLDILGKDHNLITFVNDRLGHDRKYSINDNKIRENLDFKCSIEFNKGLEETVKWYESNLNWVEAVLKDKYIEV